jgi:hypothetical protein
MNRNQLCEDWGWYVDLESTRSVSNEDQPHPPYTAKMLNIIQDIEDEYQYHMENCKKNDDYDNEETACCIKKPHFTCLISIGNTFVTTIIIYALLLFC